MARSCAPWPGARRDRDTAQTMTEELTTPDPLEVMRQGFEALNRRDFDTG